MPHHWYSHVQGTQKLRFLSPYCGLATRDHWAVGDAPSSPRMLQFPPTSLSALLCVCLSSIALPLLLSVSVSIAHCFVFLYASLPQAVSFLDAPLSLFISLMFPPSFLSRQASQCLSPHNWPLGTAAGSDPRALMCPLCLPPSAAPALGHCWSGSCRMSSALFGETCTHFLAPSPRAPCGQRGLKTAS